MTEQIIKVSTIQKNTTFSHIPKYKCYLKMILNRFQKKIKKVKKVSFDMKMIYKY
jgi:hypothetical protein